MLSGFFLLISVLYSLPIANSCHKIITEYTNGLVNERKKTETMGAAEVFKSYRMKESLTQDVLDKNIEKSIFSVEKDYLLSGNIIVPANCTLEFKGGKISGDYTITGQNTCIIGNVKFSPEVRFKGTFNNIQTVNVDWFVDEYKSNVDCSGGIRSAITLAKLARTSLSFGAGVSSAAEKYYCNRGEFDVSCLVINGNGATIVGTGNYSMFIVDGDCHIQDLKIGKYPYQDGSSNKDYGNASIICRNNHQMVFDNVIVDGFHYGFKLDAAWNVVINSCVTRRCSVGIASNGKSVNNNINNSRITGIICGIEADGISEGWMISDNLIIGATGVSVKNHANTIIKGNIIDLCKNYAIEIDQNSPGLLIDNNYMAVTNGGSAIIKIGGQQIKNDEDQMVSVTNNILKGYGELSEHSGVLVTSGKYKHIKVSGNHIRAKDLKYGLYVDTGTSITTLFVRDNVVEGNVNEPAVRIKGIVTNRFVTDNVKSKL